MTHLPDYYAILQVHHSAGKEVIDAAYRKLAAKYHPDVNASPDAAEKTKQINEAYEVLSNPERRAEYDKRSRIATGRQPLAKSWRRFIPLLGLVLMLFLVARLKTLGLVLLAMGIIIWLLFKTRRH